MSDSYDVFQSISIVLNKLFTDYSNYVIIANTFLVLILLHCLNKTLAFTNKVVVSLHLIPIQSAFQDCDMVIVPSCHRAMCDWSLESDQVKNKVSN